MAGRAWHRRVVHIMVDKKQREYRKGLQGHPPPVTYFLHLGLASYLSSPPNNAIIL
jgi:hypothetical protein